MDKAIHSDFLVYWSGRDIEKDIREHRIQKEERDGAYLKRLIDILEFGLWMKSDKDPESLHFGPRQLAYTKPKVPRTCFTELKLSESQKHAEKFGYLGLAFKRFFLFDRLGSPMMYLQNERPSLFFPPFTSFDMNSNSHMTNFFIHMHYWKHDKKLTYDMLNESEWRIVYSHQIKKQLLGAKFKDATRQFVDPKRTKDKKIRAYYKKLKPANRPEFLIPLDCWLGIIIYPNLNVKKMAVRSRRVRGLIKNVSQRPPLLSGDVERGCMPIEMNLQACNNF